MTPRENLLAVFRHETPEWIPVSVHCDPYNQPSRKDMDPALAKAMPPVQWGDGSSAVFARHLGLDVMDFFSPPLIVKRTKVKVETTNQAQGWTTTYTTPRGELREVHQRVRDDGTSYCQEHLVKSGADIPLLISLFEDEEYAFEPHAKEFMRQRKALVGEDGITRCYMPSTPLGMMVRCYSGVETIAYLWADHRAELHQLFAVMEEKYRQQFELFASLGYDLLYCTDDTSTSTISPAMFEEFCMGFTDRMADTVHKYGVKYVHHSCGLINNLLDLYRQTRMDAVDALCLKPIGDVESLAIAKEKLGPRITIIAPLIQICGDMTDRRAVADSIAGMFRDSAPGDNMVFAIGAEPTQGVEAHAFIAGECRKHQRRYL